MLPDPISNPEPTSSSSSNLSKKPVSAIAQARASLQPSVPALTKLGIKVRDFAYESTLPPIQPIFRHPRQIQPGVIRPIKRQLTETNEDDPFSQQSQKESQGSSKHLERTSTEPTLISSGTAPARAHAFSNLGDFESQTIDTMESQPSSSQMPLVASQDRDHEGYIHTPFVTPNGSLEWNRDDTASQLGAGLPHLQSLLAARSPQRNASSRQSSPLTPTSSKSTVASSSSSRSLKRSHSSQTLSPIKPRPSSSHDPLSPVAPRIIVTRYQLRKRPVLQPTPTKATRSQSAASTSRPRPMAIRTSSPRGPRSRPDPNPTSRGKRRRVA